MSDNRNTTPRPGGRDRQGREHQLPWILFAEATRILSGSHPEVPPEVSRFLRDHPSPLVEHSDGAVIEEVTLTYRRITPQSVDHTLEDVPEDETPGSLDPNEIFHDLPF